MRRPLALALAALPVLALSAVPASAQGAERAPAQAATTEPSPATPTPQSTGTPCPSNPSCDLPGGTPPPSSASPTTTTAQSARPSCPVLTPGPDGPVSPEGCQTPSPAPTNVDVAVSCPSTSRDYWLVGPNEPVEVAVTGAADTATVDLTRTTPSPVAVVRTGTGDVTWTVRVPERTVLFLEGQCSDGLRRGGRRISIDVQPTLTLAARRTSPRAYTFTGRVTPGRGQTVGLYRVEDDGRQIATASAVVGPDGTYRIDRRFVGSGRFGFVVRTAENERHRAGTTPVRPTVIH